MRGITRKAETTRRKFLAQGAAWTAGVCVLWRPPVADAALRRFSATAKPSIQFPSAPRDRISVASYPFREFIAGPEHKTGNPTIALKDFAAHVAERFQINHIEPWSAHFPSTDSKYLADFRTAVRKARSAIADIAVDGEHSPYARDAAERERAVAFSKKWVDVAVALGSPSIRTNIPPANDAKPEVALLSVSLASVAKYAAGRNVVVHLENDNPVSEDPFLLAQVIDKVNSPWLRALPDFGNSVGAHSGDQEYAYRGLDALFARAYGVCHVKNEVLGPEDKKVQVDLARAFGILRQHEYKGFCSIEYDSTGDPYKPTAELIAKTVEFLS